MNTKEILKVFNNVMSNIVGGYAQL